MTANTMSNLKIILTAVDDGLADAWERHCGDVDNVVVHRGSIFDQTCDALVSPANSFGFMDGGIDMVFSRRFGWGVQERLQEMIRTRHHGELLVGAAEIVETGDEAFPYIIAAPTMRVPHVLGYTVNPYLAARAVLLMITHGVINEGQFVGQAVSSLVQSVAFPGLGTGVGRVGPNMCAHQVRQAIDDVLGQPSFPTSWDDATRRHKEMYIAHLGEIRE